MRPSIVKAVLTEPLEGRQKRIAIWSAAVWGLWMALQVGLAIAQSPDSLKWATLVLPIGWQVGMMVWIRRQFSRNRFD